MPSDTRELIQAIAIVVIFLIASSNLPDLIIEATIAPRSAQR